MTPEQRAALEALVPPEQRTGDDATDLVAAVREAGRRREETKRQGGHATAALHELDPSRFSWRKLDDVVGIPNGTLRRWVAEAEGSVVSE